MSMVSRAIPENAYAEQWNVAGLKADVANFLNLDLPVEEWAKEEGIADDEIRERAYQLWNAAGWPACDGVEFWYKAERELRPS